MHSKPSMPVVGKGSLRHTSPTPDSDSDEKPGGEARATVQSARSGDGPLWQRFKNAVLARTPRSRSAKKQARAPEASPYADARVSSEDMEDVPGELEFENRTVESNKSSNGMIALPIGDTEPALFIPEDPSTPRRSTSKRKVRTPSNKPRPPEGSTPRSPTAKPACRGVVEIQSEENGPWMECYLELWTAHLAWYLQGQSGFNLAADTHNGQFFLEPPCSVKCEQTSNDDKVAEEIGRTLEVAGEKGKLKLRCNVEGEVRPWMVCLEAAMKTVEERCCRKQWSFVYLNVYDLLQDRRVELFNWVMKDLLQAGGAFHAGVEVFNREYYYGSATENISGVSWCKPRQAPRHSFRQSLCLGITCWDEARIKAQVRDLMPEWRAQSYDVLTRNCMSFCRELCRRIGVQQAPDWIDALPIAAGERRLLQEQAVQGVQLGEFRAEEIQVRCSMGHECQLLAQSFIAAIVKTIACERCARQLRRGEPRWHCEECDLALCEPCVALAAAKL